MIVAGRQHTFADRKRNVFQLRAIELLYGGIKSITIEVYNDLTQVPAQLQFSDIVVGSALVRGQVNLLQQTSLCQDLVDLLCKILVLDFLVVEELGALGCIVDDLGDLCLVYSILSGFCERGAEQVVL